MTARRTILPFAAALALVACGGGNATTDSAGATGAATGAVTTPGAGMTTGSVTGATAGATTGAAAATAPAGALLDPNAATREQIAALPGMTPALADSLVAKRPHKDMRDVNRLLGALTEQQRDTIYARMFLPLDLNSATAEEIELIPGVGRRMRGEFLEYRPYKDIGQFRREIGKYVDEAEVARLEKYVRVGG